MDFIGVFTKIGQSVRQWIRKMPDITKIQQSDLNSEIRALAFSNEDINSKQHPHPGA
ncbi:hypothetical protein SAMN05428947_102326 [Mucilaginibacter sp. OK283]|jgi:hypothetical protein|nr:hypothetical protein SAMN05428947_102326 [Mucilaginibacter sp. OK283]